MNSVRALLLYLLVTLFLIFEMAVQVSPSVMTLQLMRDLHLDNFQLGFMSGIYFYTYTIMQIPAGLIFDRYNPRYIISATIMLCTLGTSLFGFSHDIYFGCLARLLMGTGSAFAFISVLVVTSDIFHHRYFAILTGVTQMLAAFGAIIGQAPLSILVNRIGWRYTLFFLSLVGLVLCILVIKFLNYKKEQQILIDDKIKSVQDLIKGLRQVLSKKQTWVVGLYVMLLWAPMSCFASLWGVPYLMNIYNLSQNVAASLMAFMWIGLALLSPLLGWISTVAKSRVTPLWLSAFIGCLAFTIILFVPLSNLIIIAVLLFIAGAACSGQALSFTSIKENNEVANKGTAIAFNNMAVVISGAILQPLVGKILQILRPIATTNSDQIHTTYSMSQFKLSLILVQICYFFGAIIAFHFIKETYSDDKLTN